MKFTKSISSYRIKKKDKQKNWERAQNIKWRKISNESSESDYRKNNGDLRILKIISKTIEK